MRRQLTIAATAIASMIVIAFLVPLALLVRTIAADRALASAEQSATVLATISDRRDLDRAVATANTGDPAFVTVFFADDSVVGRAVDLGLVADDLRLARTGQSFSTDEDGGTAIYIPVGGLTGVDRVVRAFIPGDVLNRGVAPAWIVLSLLGLALIAVGTVVADRFAKSIAEPVHDLATTAEALGQGDLQRRVVPSGPPEIVEVGQTLNQLAGRIEGLLTAERESVADLSHRLRTPVTALRLEVEGLNDLAERERLIDVIDALEDAVTRLIRSARAGASPPGDRLADLVAVTTERFEFWRPLAEDQDRTFDLDVPDGVTVIPVRLAPDELAAGIDALLGNVLAHTPDGTGFRVRLGADRTLLVEDDGDGFGAADPSARGVSGGGSTGLGLDIVRQMAEAAGGELRVGRSPSGGARVEVLFGTLTDLSPEP